MRFWILIFAGLLLSAFMVVRATQTGAALVFKPSELRSRGASSDQRIRVIGRVANDSIRYQLKPQIQLDFSVTDPGQAQGATLPVVYRGLKPDMFSPGRDVIIDGRLQGDTLVASKLLTQCPSKYEAPDPSNPTGAKS